MSKIIKSIIFVPSRDQILRDVESGGFISGWLVSCSSFGQDGELRLLSATTYRAKPTKKQVKQCVEKAKNIDAEISLRVEIRGLMDDLEGMKPE